VGEGVIERMIDETAVIKHISPDDRMFSADFRARHGRDAYFYCGRSAVECIQRGLDAASISPEHVQRILDLPSGHGRVLRYLKVAFPHAEITACDLLRDAVDFCSSTFGALSLYSSEDPESIPLHPESFDLVWVGSLFTHLDSPKWSRFLSVLRNSLRPGGLLVFTAHGRDAYRRMLADTFDYGVSHWDRTILLHRYERAGFAYVRYAGSSNDVGISLSHPAWVIRHLTALGGLRLVDFSESSWVNFHDVFACLRDPTWAPDTRHPSSARYLRHRVASRLNPRLRSVLEPIWRAGKGLGRR
jgi:SAM-dependent methyltransferase